MQIDELTAFCQRRNWKIVRVFEDQQSGKTIDRPSFKEMNRLLRLGKADGIVCWKLDRVFRNAREALITLHQYSEQGIMFCSLHDPEYDPTNPHSRLMMTIIAGFAQLEADIIKQRVVSGLKSAKERGVKLGRPRVNVQAEMVIKLKNEGLSFGEISKRLGISKATAHRLSQKPSKNESV